MPSDIIRRLAAIASRQHGLITRKQAALHVTAGWIAARVRDGRWERVHRGVYRFAGAPRSFRQDALAACLAANDEALASHWTALRLLGADEMGIDLRIPTGSPEIVVPRGRRCVVRGVRVHEARDLEAADRSRVHGVPATTIVRTVVDVAPRLEPNVLERLLDELLRRRVLTVSRLEWRLSRLSPRGTGVLRRLVRDRRLGVKPRDSDLEKLFSDIVHAAGLPEPVPQYHVRDHGRVLGRIDFAYPEVRVGVELDGGQHLELRQRRHDVKRQTSVQSRDWILQRFSRGDMRTQPEEVAADLARTLTSRALGLGRHVPRMR